MNRLNQIDLILTKIHRTKQIESLDGQTLISEGVDANYMDMINYALFGLIKLTFEEDKQWIKNGLSKYWLSSSVSCWLSPLYFPELLNQSMIRHQYNSNYQFNGKQCKLQVGYNNEELLMGVYITPPLLNSNRNLFGFDLCDNSIIRDQRQYALHLVSQLV